MSPYEASVLPGAVPDEFPIMFEDHVQAGVSQHPRHPERILAVGSA